MTVVDNTVCYAAYEAFLPVTENLICATDEGKDVCQGDSGGKITIYDLYYSHLYRSPDNHEGWWILLTDRCGGGRKILCIPGISRGEYQGYSVFTLD